MTQYDTFIQSKLAVRELVGFEPERPLSNDLFGFQSMIVRWALRVGRCAIFAECGLGKTLMQLEWARHVAAHTGKPVLILCPLAVAGQTVREAHHFEYHAKHIRTPEEMDWTGIYVTNFDSIDKFDGIEFGGVVIDESSILKSFTGKLRRQLTDRFSQTHYRLCCTATPAPNDYTELGQHADFLGICSQAEMLARYFINDTFDTGDWRLKGHAREAFWRWVASWACCISKPSDLGFSDKGYDIPPATVKIRKVETQLVQADGMLFDAGALSATEIHAENRRTIDDRVAEVVDVLSLHPDEPAVIWCENNDESEALAAAIPDSVEVSGYQSEKVKEAGLEAFITGKVKRLITKPGIAGLGLNFQHCAVDIYASLSFSWERFYQSGKRIHRFGQKRPVNRYILVSDATKGVLDTVLEKGEKHAEMKELLQFTREQLMSKPNPVLLNTEVETATGEGWTIHRGDCVRAAALIEDESVGCSVFSPPFADLFTYSADAQDMGNNGSLEEFFDQFRFLVAEINRVTMPGRECCVHCCDLLSTKWKDGSIGLKDFSSKIAAVFNEFGWVFHSRITIWKDPVTEMQRTKAHGLLYKTLCKDSAQSRVGVPDYLLVFRKPGINPVPINHSASDLPLSKWQELASPVWMTIDQGNVLNGRGASESEDERHICPLQLDVIERALTLWSAPGDLVYSPFTGIGSEGYVALKMKRRFVGSELKDSYHATACDNLELASQESKTLFDLV